MAEDAGGSDRGDVEVHVEIGGVTRRVGLLRRHATRRGESVTFEYDDAWLGDPARFAIDPNLALGPGTYAPRPERAMIPALGDTAPDSWGRRLMQRAERRDARLENRHARTLSETDYLLGVSDATRLGALRLRCRGDGAFQAPTPSGVPPLIALGQLLASTDRLSKNEGTDADLALVLAPGSSLGGARPKASVLDAHGRLSIAKFPKPDDDYSIETWEAITMRLAKSAGIDVPVVDAMRVADRAVLLTRRFDRAADGRVPFVSAMTLLDGLDGERGSYPDIVDALSVVGAAPRADAAELYRRVAFSVLVSNVDDHLRNHGVLHDGRRGWRLSPAFDLNPMPVDLKARVLATDIDGSEGTCSIDLVREVAPLFDLSGERADAIVGEVAHATRAWRDVAASFGERPGAIERMASAFEHADLDAALAL